MKGAAARGPEEGNYQFDQDGYLQRKEDETDEQHVARTAEALFREGMSSNHPSDVMSQYDEPEPPDAEVEEGMSKEDYAEKCKQEKEEWGKRNEEHRKEAYEHLKQEREEREKDRDERDKERGFNKEEEQNDDQQEGEQEEEYADEPDEETEEESQEEPQQQQREGIERINPRR